jgi:hypothetical protein
MNKHRFHAQRILRRGAAPTSTTTLKAGDPLRSKVRVVCASCNNTWLSQLQQPAKPYRIPLFQGQRTALSSAAQERIAAWCTTATTTAEFVDPDPHSIAVPQSDRDRLMNNRTPSPNWRIWIGNIRAAKLDSSVGAFHVSHARRGRNVQREPHAAAVYRRAAGITGRSLF